MSFFGLLYSAEPEESVASGFLWGHAGADVLLGGEMEMSGKFGCEIALSLAFAKEGA